MKDKQIVLFYPLMSLFLLAIQSMQLFSIYGIRPDMIMLFVIIYTFARNPFKGELFGFVLGLMLDLMSGVLFGLNAFIFTLLGSFITIFQKTVKLANVMVFIIYIVISTIIKYLLYTIFYKIYEDVQLVDWYFIFKIPGEIIINIIFGLILYLITARFDSREEYEWF